MTQEEKAKRYDEALERAKKYKLKEDLIITQDLFPELKESEDERIRKAIKLMYSFLPNNPKYIGDVPIKEIFAWLEKQGKNNMGISEATKQKLEDNLNKALEKETPESWNKFLDEQGEQKPADKVEQKKLKKTKFKTGDRIIAIVSGMQYYITDICDDHYNTESGCIIMFCAQDNFELYKQKPAWSEEDERKSLEIKCLIGNYRTGNDEYELCSWIDKLKNRVQPKQEAYNDALDKLEYHSGNPIFDDGWSAAIWYLKKINAQPQNTWKPSDEQMEQLGWIAEQNKDNMIGKELMTLYNDLKKLKG